MGIQHSAATKPSEEPKQSLLREALSLLLILLFAAVLIFLFQAFVCQFIRVDGTSMESTLHDGEIVLVSKWDSDYRAGDVVICHYPNRMEGVWNLSASLAVTRRTLFVKRLVALPGDTVMIRNGKLSVNGVLQEDPPHMGSVPLDYPARTLGENEYFVIGDNRFSSRDSRSPQVGPIGGDMLRGKVKWVLWPFSNFREIH